MIMGFVLADIKKDISNNLVLTKHLQHINESYVSHMPIYVKMHCFYNNNKKTNCGLAEAALH